MTAGAIPQRLSRTFHMKSWRANILKIGLPIAAVAALSACGSANSPDTRNPKSDPAVSVPQAEETVTLTGLPLAAENFEALTEQAFTASPGQLDSLFTKTQESVTGISGQLDPETSKAVDARLMDVKAALAAGNPADVALSAVEGYKLIVSAFPPDAKIPVAVSLLDYAGFRIQADLKSDPAHWDDAREAAQYAHEQWELIRSNVTDTELNKRFSASLADLDEYLSVKDEKMAAKAAASELNLVDELEGFFQSTPKTNLPNNPN